MMPRAVVFDLYGTLLDYSSLAATFAGSAAAPEAFVAAWRTKQLAYAMAATLMDRYADFDELTRRAYAYAAASHGMANDDESGTRAVAAWASLPAFADVAPALAHLASRGVVAAVLSNGKPSALAEAMKNAGLAGRFARVLSVDAVRRFKPHPSVYALATEAFDCEPHDIVFVSSNGWDSTGAAEFGFRVVWCNRGNLPAETFGAAPQHTIASLAELAAVLE
jgi:2-haloacid dehalogenase